MLDVVIICSSFPAREKLLERSYVTWVDSMVYSGLKCKAFIFENGYKNFASVIDTHFQRYTIPEKSGSHITGYNYWTERVDAKVYLYTHPDLLFPRDTVRVAYEEASKGNTFAAFKCFWMLEEMTENIEKYDWRHPETLEKEVALYPKFNDGHGEYFWNSDVRDKTEWGSTTTFAIDSDLAHKIYPMPNLSWQGYDDPLHYAVRRLLGVKDETIMNPILMHQHHPSTWNGDSEAAVREAIELLETYYKPKFGII